MQHQLVKIATHVDFVKYNPDWVESIIFGHRMPEEKQRCIMQNYKHPISFKKIVVSGMGFAVVDIR